MLKLTGERLRKFCAKKKSFCQINFKTGKKKPIAVITKCNRFTANLPDQVWVCCVCALLMDCYQHNVQHKILFGEAFLAAFYTATAIVREMQVVVVPPLLLLTALPPGCASPY